MKIAVVGAGISGLTCAYRLQQQGHSVKVFESESEVGGRMGTTHVGGFPVDTGVNLLLANYERMHALCDELGIAEQLFDFQSGAGGILRDHELNSFTPSNVFEILRYRGVSLVSRMRLIRYFVRAYRFTSSLDFFDLSVGEDLDADRDAFSATSEQLDEEIATYIVDPFVRTFHFHGARQMSMKYFDALVALFVGKGNFKPQGFRDFMQTLPRTLAERLDVETGAAVSLIRPSTGNDDAPVEVDGEAFDVAVLAIPAPLALGVLAPPSPDQREVLSRTTYAPTLSVAFRCPVGVAEDFEGIWIPYHESSLISECSNETCKGSSTPTECVINFGLHTEAAAAWLGRPDEEIFETLSREWARLFPRYEGALEGLHVQRWPLAMPIYGPGHVERVRQFWKRGQGDGRVYLCGDYLNHPWVEGSIRCGEKIAVWIRETEAAAH